MPAHRKTKAEKLRRGTLNVTREAQRKKPEDPASELQEAKEMLAMMQEDLRAANAELREHGLMITTTIANNHGKFTEVQRVNPMLKIQREALRAIKILKQQIAVLQEEAPEKAKQEQEDAETLEMEEFKI